MNGVTVAICCYNSSARIAETLRHLSLQRLSENIPWEVLIFDNACTDDTVEVAHRAWQGVQPAPLRIVPEKIPGLMQARHCAMRESRYELVSFIDDDNWVAADWVERVWQRLQTDPDMAACGGQNAAATEVAAPYWFDRMAYAYAVGKQAESSSYVTPQRGFLWGAGLTIRKSAWYDLFGCGFTSKLSGRKGGQLTAGEDSELCLAFMSRGWKLFYDERLQLTHFIPKNRLTDRYINGLFQGFGRSETILMIYRANLDKTFKIKSVWWKNCISAFRLLLRFLIRSIFSPRIDRFVNRVYANYEWALVSQLFRERKAFDRLFQSITDFSGWCGRGK